MLTGGFFWPTRIKLKATVVKQLPCPGADYGGRGGTRTPGPLLAKQGGENTKRLCWCRLHGKSTKFSLFNCPEVVPNIPVFRSSALQRSPGSITHMPVLQFPGHFRVANRELRAGRFAALTLPSLSGRRPVRHALPRNRLRRAA